jgi:hypothetical protein
MMGWLSRLFARPAPIPPAPADMLGAATLPHVVVPPPIPEAAVELIKR